MLRGDGKWVNRQIGASSPYVYIGGGRDRNQEGTNGGVGSRPGLAKIKYSRKKVRGW